MHISHLASSVAQTSALKPKEVSVLPAAANPSTTGASAAQPAQVSSPAPLPAFEDSEISDSAGARQGAESASSSILGDSNTALAAQANLNPETVLQLLAD